MRILIVFCLFVLYFVCFVYFFLQSINSFKPINFYLNTSGVKTTGSQVHYEFTKFDFYQRNL